MKTKNTGYKKYYMSLGCSAFTDDIAIEHYLIEIKIEVIITCI